MLSERIKQRLRDLPDGPGCYLMRDRRGTIIYVGRAASLRKRVQSYFRAATLRSAEPKLRSLIHSVEDLEFIVARTEAEAILTEGKLIKDYRPRYNVSFRDDKRFLLLRVLMDDPFPRFRLCRIQRNDGARYFGPYASSAAARAALDFIEKKYGLRKCPPRVPGPEDHRHCINDIVRYCSAPCLGSIQAAEYAARVEMACDFLAGRRPGDLKELRTAMEEAAAGREFERAAAIRDTYLLLHAAVKQRVRLAATPEFREQEGRSGVTELQKILKLAHRPRVIEAYDVSTISGTHSVASMVCSENGIPQRARYRRFRIRTVEGADDPAMMAEVIQRRFEGLREARGHPPDLVLVDGGITQVRAAQKEMRDLGFGNVAVAGLAKQHEEIHTDTGFPLRLAADSPALKVLQHIRDEAHRFALTYHRRLRAKRLRESALDEIPGIGKKRKQTLLTHFGSLRRLKKAAEEEIAAVPGVGRAMAREIKAMLGEGDSAAQSSSPASSR